MKIVSTNHNEGAFTRWRVWLKALPEKLSAKVVDIVRTTKKVAEDDPRRIIHGIKVGLAMTVVSLFYYFNPLEDNFGDSTIWAVLSVIVVFEFSVGATLGKGLNRVIATFLASFLGVGIHRLATLTGETGQPILLGLFVFLIAAAATFLRFFPQMKARYDYGLLIFTLTFCLISVSKNGNEEVLDMAIERLSTILMGASTAMITCIFICPVWAGDELHNLVATNIEKLGNFLEGFGGEYLRILGDGQSQGDKTFLQGYKSVLNSKSSEESLANFAKWEPHHGRFMFRHPWKQYLVVGVLARQCAYQIEALNGYLNSEIKTPPEIRSKIQEACTKISSESGKVLKELASAIKNLTLPSLADPHIAHSKVAAKNLKALLKTGLWEDSNVLEMIPAATVASLLIDVANCTEKIVEAVHELASLARFKRVQPTRIQAQDQPTILQLEAVQACSSTEEPLYEQAHERKEIILPGTVQSFSGMEEPHHVITIEVSSPVTTKNGNSL
ncbi:hypothetical protein F0562_001635 [Nyssa sinensis]|uniref:Aluminum-activated malate transporter n=1 Tax=Nyssa sinensis TaxID=561372 RepID=A0A5J5C7Q6_9ASTE|nr:hypothetical protein F0562_001635 [Nyssa sinensis]